VKQKSKLGVDVKNPWQLACSRFKTSKKPLKESDAVAPLDSSERALAELLAQASNSSAATFINLLKSKGFKIIAPPELQDAEMDQISAKASPKESQAKLAEPASWAVDEELWDKAKKAASKSYGQDDPAYWPSVVVIYKNMGGSIKGKKEAASASSFPQVTRGVKESNIKDSFCGQMRFLESYSDEHNPTRFRCVLIQEGLGNFGDAYYYTRQALESAVPVFEGKKIYADHPDKVEEEARPERSVKDVLGHFENVKLEEGKDGRAMLTADVVVLPDEPYQWARALMRHSVEYSKKYPDKDFIGLSINARGDSTIVPMSEWTKEAKIPASSMEKLRQAQEKGIDQIRLVTAIREAISCDMVTEAGAGGRIINFIEGAK